MYSLGPIDRAFRETCKILFKAEIGGLLEFEPYLKECIFPYSVVELENNQKVMLGSPYYRGKVASADGMSWKAPRFSVNQIKDIDSLFEAAKEISIYCGNKAFGKNHNIHLLDNAKDCIDVYFAHNATNVKKGAYLSCIRNSEYVFGIPAFAKIKHSIRCVEGMNANRMFESHYISNCSDMYYCINCHGCSEIIFGFNLRNKHYCIGNLGLGKEKYFELKAKLLSEIAEILAKRKRIFSLGEILKQNTSEENPDFIPTQPPPPSVQKAFAKATEIVLKVKREDIVPFVSYLQSKTLPVQKANGRFKSQTYRPFLPVVKDIPFACLCTNQEAQTQDKPLIEGKSDFRLQSLVVQIAKNASTTLEMREGDCKEVYETSQVISSNECWSAWDFTFSSRCACSTGVGNCEYVFGGGNIRILESKFCINCYNSINLQRCFEADSCVDCSDCYFCHNLEGCQECILCFNLKGKRYAVLNQELKKEQYYKIKKMLLDYINSELDKKKSISRSIFEIG
ncbi:MAG: hypothetical protein QXT25_00125 [Candidatus Anstonellaceae archaeon]